MKLDGIEKIRGISGRLVLSCTSAAYVILSFTDLVLVLISNALLTESKHAADERFEDLGS